MWYDQLAGAIGSLELTPTILDIRYSQFEIFQVKAPRKIRAKNLKSKIA